LIKIKPKGFSGDCIKDSSEITKVKNFLKMVNKSNDGSQNDEILKDLVSLETILNHKKIATRQRENYNLMKNNLPDDYLLIELDYKQKVYLI
jgi:hypothetical protein